MRLVMLVPWVAKKWMAPHGVLAPIDTHERGLGVDAVGEESLVGLRVAVERRWGPVDARAVQLAMRQHHLGGGHVVMGVGHRLDDSVDDRGKGRWPQTVRRQVVHQVSAAPAGPGVRVRRGDQGVLLGVGVAIVGVGVAIGLRQAAQHFVIHVLHGHRQLGHHQQQSWVLVLGIIAKDKRP